MATEKQGPESSPSGSGRHQVHQGADDRRHHHRGDPGGEHGREQRGEHPDRRPGGPAAVVPSLELAQEVEEQRDASVGAGHERDGARVVARAVDGQRRVARQRGEAQRGQ